MEWQGRMFGWRRLAVALAGTLLYMAVLLPLWPGGVLTAAARIVALAIVALVVFGLLESWPRHLPSRLPRWLVQVVGLAVAMPATLWIIYVAFTPSGEPYFWYIHSRRIGFVILACSSALVAIVLALYAVALERSEFERQALAARMRLLQAQVQPHFLFNTLANVRSLVETGSPQAISVLDNLIDYLQAAVPRLRESETTLEQELQLVRAYLELMRMRIPDRLSFELRVDEPAKRLLCPPMTLLALVENAVRHGIDPSEEGGRIDIEVRLQSNRCTVVVTDTGVGLQAASRGLGTGLATLRERLDLAFGGDADLRVEATRPRGVTARIDFPAKVIAS